ncbi:hypothetical protein THAOC_24712 [Thalassiosira oceanica]|uniref:Uncharacterized protein n=1 Tax=Thalassiosira oceanica TaxID=159749 RepID=K0RT57_THAOC|nr:hypothetical protein THAOC_24712 [Thalassiosira oceanica]|eukprot:EJK55549.1 hypothetical protein THAOC_24712 [Thalassiosira oceanica]
MHRWLFEVEGGHGPTQWTRRRVEGHSTEQDIDFVVAPNTARVSEKVTQKKVHQVCRAATGPTSSRTTSFEARGAQSKLHRFLREYPPAKLVRQNGQLARPRSVGLCADRREIPFTKGANAAELPASSRRSMAMAGPLSQTAPPQARGLPFYRHQDLFPHLLSKVGFNSDDERTSFEQKIHDIAAPSAATAGIAAPSGVERNMSKRSVNADAVVHIFPGRTTYDRRLYGYAGPRRATDAWEQVYRPAMCPWHCIPAEFEVCQAAQTSLAGPHRHNWRNADEQGVDARRHVAFRSGSPKNLRYQGCGHTVLAHARFQTAPTSLLTLQTCGGGLRLGRVKIMNSRSGTAACIGRAGLFSASEREEAVRPQIEISAVDLSPEKDLQHRLEVLALATDGEEWCPMEEHPAGPAQGRAVLAGSVQLGPLPCAGAPSISWGQRSVYEVGATQRNGSITCFSRQEGWTYFCPKRKKCETRHWMPGPVRIGSDSLTTV